jgi:WD40 repeat protein
VVHFGDLAFSPNGAWLDAIPEYYSKDDNRHEPISCLSRLTSPSNRIGTVIRGQAGLVDAAVPSFSNDGHWLVTRSDKPQSARVVDLFSADPAKPSSNLADQADELSAAAVSDDGHWLFTSFHDGTSKLWDAHDPNVSYSNSVKMDVRTARFSPDNNWLITGNQDGTVGLWNLKETNGQNKVAPASSSVLLRELQTPVENLTFSPDCKWLVAAGIGISPVRFWRLDRGDPSSLFPILGNHSAPFATFVATDDDRWLLTGHMGKQATLWNLRESDPRTAEIPLRGNTDFVEHVAVSRSSRFAATGSRDKTVRMWKLDDGSAGSEWGQLPVQSAQISALSFSRDDKLLAVGNDDGTLQIFEVNQNVATGYDRQILFAFHKKRIMSLAFSPDNRWMISASEDGVEALWSLANTSLPSTPASVIQTNGIEIREIAVSPDSRSIAAGLKNGTTNLCELSSKRVPDSCVSLSGHADAIASLAFSPDSKWLATGSDDHSVRLWNLGVRNPKNQALVLHGHADGVRSVEFSPDGHWLVTGAYDQTIRLWDMTAQDPSTSAAVLQSDFASVNYVHFTSDEKRLISGGFYTIHQWPLAPDDLIHFAHDHVGRNLTKAEWDQYFPNMHYRMTFSDLPDLSRVVPLSPSFGKR